VWLGALRRAGARDSLLAHRIDRTLDQATGRLGGDTELLTHLSVAALAPVREAEALLDRIPRPRVEDVEQVVERFLVFTLEQHLLGRGHVGRQQVDQLTAVVVAHRAIEGRGGGEAVQPGALVVELLAVARGLAECRPQGGGTVARQANQAGLLVERPTDGLADPGGGVRGELEALAPVELVDGVLEAEVALLDQVEQLHRRGEGIASGDAHHEPQIRPNEAVLRGGSGGDGLAQLTATLTRVEGRPRVTTTFGPS